MINVEFFNFSKKNNSTKQPSNGTVFPCALKQETVFQSPAFIIKYDFNKFLNFNYCKWNDHYYFIDSIKSINASQVEVDCTEDVLATYKTQIGNYRCFIERSMDKNKLFPDAMYQPTDEWTRSDSIVGEPVNTFVNGYSGNFIVRTCASDGINLYYMKQEELDALLEFMWSDGSWGDLLSDAWIKLFFDPFKYILSIAWTPIRLDKFLYVTDTVKLGFWDSKVQSNLIGGTNSPTVKFSYDLSLTNPTYQSTDFRFWNTAFSKYSIQLPLIGVIPVDVTKTNNGQLKADYYYDAVSGLCDIWLRSGSINLSHYQAMMSVPIEIGYASSNMTNLIGSGASAITSAYSGNLVGSLTSGIQAVQSATAPEPSVIGSTGTITSVLENKDATVMCFTRASIRPHVTTEGYADGNIQLIDDLGGFIKCRNASIEINGYTGDQEKINNYLNSGFYYE